VLNFVVDGSVDLAKQTLDISMTPSLNQANKNINAALATAQIVRISGPFDNLSVGLNAGKTTQNLLQAGLTMLGGLDATQKPTQRMLCAKALGGYQMARKKVVQQAKPQAAQTQPVAKTEPKKEFKQQLIDSLSKAIQAGVQQGAH
jgi:hypothetical protein